MPATPRVFGHDVFYGALQFAHESGGVTLSHRLASKPPEEVELHTHPEAHFVLVTGGQYISTAAGSPRDATLIFNPPGTTHRDRFAEGRGSFFTISIPQSWLGDSLAPDLASDATHLNGPRPSGLARSLFLHGGRPQPQSQLHTEALLIELLGEVSTHPRLPAAGRPSWLSRAAELIQDSYRERITVRQISRSIGVHPVHLARAFRSWLGCTPGELLRARKLEMAAAALSAGRLPISQIALDHGFADQAQFTKAFRRVYGLTPGAYRRCLHPSRRQNRRQDELQQ